MMTDEFLPPELTKIDLEDFWFQHYGSTPNSANDAIDLLCSTNLQKRWSQLATKIMWFNTVELFSLRQSEKPTFYFWTEDWNYSYHNRDRASIMSKYENFNKTVDICRAAREFHSANIFSVHILILRLSKKDIKNECNYVFYSPEKPFTYQIKLKYFFFPPSVL